MFTSSCARASLRCRSLEGYRQRRPIGLVAYRPNAIVVVLPVVAQVDRPSGLLARDEKSRCLELVHNDIGLLERATGRATADIRP